MSRTRTDAEWAADVARLTLKRIDGMALELNALSLQFGLLAGRADDHGMSSAAYMLRRFGDEVQLILASAAPIVTTVLEKDLPQ